MNINGRLNRLQAGFGIIETMIALLLGIIIMLGVTEIATRNSKTTYEVERAGMQIENATYALRLLERDLTSAGYWGERRKVDLLQTPGICPITACDETDFPSLDDASCELNWAMAYPVQGGHIYDAPFNVAPNDRFACTPSPFFPKAGTDYIAVRRASSCALGATGCDAAGTNFHVQVDACYIPGAVSSSDRIKVDQDVLELTYQNRDCTTTAPIYRYLNHIYYINAEDQLVRAELEGDAYAETPLVNDIEMLRFEYGLDTDGDGVEDLAADPDDPYPSEPDTANGADAADVARWANVVRITISLIVRSPQASAGFRDEKIYRIAGLKYDYTASPLGKAAENATYCANIPPRPACTVTIPVDFERYRRQLFTRTVSLRNVTGRRQTP